MSVGPDPVGLPLPAAGDEPSRNLPDRGNVLVPLANGGVTQLALETGRTIASGEDAELVLLNVVSLPEQTPLPLARHSETDYSRATARARELVLEGDPTLAVRESIRYGRTLSNAVVEAIEKHSVGVLVLDEAWRDARLSPVRKTPLQKIASSIDVAMVAPGGGSFPESPASILVPIAGGPHSRNAAVVARAIAQARDSWIELLHVVTPGDVEAHAASDQLLSAAVARLDSDENVDTWVLEAENVAEAIIEQSQYYDATVIGAPQTPRLRRFVFGSTSKTIQERVADCVITVW